MARKEKQYHFIYKTTCLLNDKYYYGMHSTDNLNDGYYGSGRRLKRSLNKHGKENHQVEFLEFLPNRKLLIGREKQIINLNEIAKEDCMNLVIGGSGGIPLNLNIEEFHRLGGKASGKIHAEKLKNDSEYKKKHVTNLINRIKKARLTKKCGCDWSNRKHTDEEKRKIGNKNSMKQKGERNSQYGTCWINNGVECKKIKKVDFHLYSNNWSLGRKIKNSLINL